MSEKQKRALLHAHMGFQVDEERLLVSLAAIRMARLQPKITLDYLRKTVSSEIPLTSGMLELPTSSIQTLRSAIERGVYALTTRQSDALRAGDGNGALLAGDVREALELSILVKDEAKELKTPLTYLLRQGATADGNSHARAEIVETLAKIGERLADQRAASSTILIVLSAILNAKADEVLNKLMAGYGQNITSDVLLSRRQHLFDDFECNPDIEAQWKTRIQKRQNDPPSQHI